LITCQPLGKSSDFADWNRFIPIDITLKPINPNCPSWRSTMKNRFSRWTVYIIGFVLVFNLVAAGQRTVLGQEPTDPFKAGDEANRDANILQATYQRTSLRQSETGLYIIRLADPPLANYRGGISGLAPTSPSVTGERKLDTRTPASRAYLAYLEGKQKDAIKAMEAALDRPLDVQFQYLNVLNALAVRAEHDEAIRLAQLPGVVAVYADELRELDTDVGPTMIGAPTIWNGDTGIGDSTHGEGIIVGVLDTGINSQHPSFADTDDDGYTHTNPYGSGIYVGWCVANPSFCNAKLIGAYTFHPNGGSPEDTNDHGSHTASTAAGNKHVASITVGPNTFDPTISGVAPRANIIAYKVCDPTCPTTGSLAAINQAILDGVDVLNYSISGTDNPWVDLVDLAFLNAFNAGIFVSASAGNAGPGPSTGAHTGPWNASVGATTHNRIIANTVDVTAPTPVPAELVGIGAVPGTGPGLLSDLSRDIVYAGHIDEANILGCSSFLAGSFTGKIALIQRGTCTFSTKVTNATNAGADAVLISNNVAGPPTSMGGLEATSKPALMIGMNDGLALRDAVTTNLPTATTVQINANTFLVTNDDWEDVMAGFSSRGPSQLEILKPDFTAPGVNILAAIRSQGGDPVQYGFQQGTSMSSPHSAGAAALLMALHPSWSPAEIKSAMASTAYNESVLKEDGLTPADPFDMGSGRLDLTKASRTGLVLDETHANFVAANPASGGDPKTLNLPSLVNSSCRMQCSWTRTLKSVLSGPANYSAEVSAPAGMTITVNPASFTVPAGGTQTIEITANVGGLPVNAWAFAEVRLQTTAKHVGNSLPVSTIHFPVAVTPVKMPPSLTVDSLLVTSTQGKNRTVTQTLTLGNDGDEDLVWEIQEEMPESGIVAHAPSPSSILTETQVLYNQTGNTSSFGSLAIYDLDDPGPWSVQAADDFFVPPGDIWTIETIDANGFYDGLLNPAGQVNVFFYSDNGGLPGSQLHAFLSLTPAGDDDGRLQLNLPTPVVLDEGTYWVSVQPKMDFFTDGRWYWFMESVKTNNPFAWRNPGNGYGTGCTGWTPGSDCGFTNPDLSFRLLGTRTGPCSSLGDIPWISASPSSGTTTAGSTDQVSLLFNSSGLVDGPYSGNICIASNDPANPLVVVPVTMDVVTQFGVELSPASNALSGYPGEIIQYTLNLTNTGSVSDSFKLGLSGSSWPASLPATSIATVGIDQTVQVHVLVTIPPKTPNGNSQTINLTATSIGDGSQTASATLTTTAIWPRIYLPLLVKP
jgi:subtilisin family serine protease